MKRVADALFGADQHRLAVQILSCPNRLAIVGTLERLLVQQPPKFVMPPPLRETAQPQQQDSVVEVRIWRRALRKLLFKYAACIVETADVVIRDCEIEKRVDVAVVVTGLEFVRLLKCH